MTHAGTVKVEGRALPLASPRTVRPRRARATRPALVVVGVGAAVAACGFDMQGTEFAAPGHASGVDASAATAAPTRPDAMEGESANESPLGSGAGAGAPASRGGPPSEALATLSGLDSSSETAPMDDASLVDDASFDAPPAPDMLALALDSSAEGAPGFSSCDVDGDGYLAKGAPCLGNDCCDTDRDVHPGQTAYFTSPSRCGSFDYDCDGLATPEYAVANCRWVGLGCTGDGFVDITPCGVTASFTVCASTSALTCMANVGSLTQACH